jgi:hypothetical protein
LGYEPGGGGPLTWHASADAAAGATLLHALAQHSSLLRCDAAWIARRARTCHMRMCMRGWWGVVRALGQNCALFSDGHFCIFGSLSLFSATSRGAAAAVGPLWHECLGRLLCHSARLALTPPPPSHAAPASSAAFASSSSSSASAAAASACDDPIAAATAAAAPILLLHLSTLRLLIEDPKSAEFAAGTEVSRLRGVVGTTAAHAPAPGSAAAAPDAAGGGGVPAAPSGLLSGGAGGVGVVPPRSVAAAVVDLCALVLKGHGASDGAGSTSSSFSSSSDAAAEGLACYLAHRLLHAHCARGAPPLPLRAGWVSLWRGAAAALRRAAAPGALSRPRVPRLAAQCLNLLAFALAAGGTLLPASSDAEALVGVIVGARGAVLRLGAAAARAGLLDPADVASLAPPDEAEEGEDGHNEGSETTYALVAPPDAHAASGANAAPLLRMRPLLDVFAVFGDVAPAKVPRFIAERYGAHLMRARARARWPFALRFRTIQGRESCPFSPSFGAHLGRFCCCAARAGLLPKVTLDRLDAGYAAGGSTSEAAASATAALSRALCAAAAPSPAAPPRTGELDAALGGARAGEGAPAPRLSTVDDGGASVRPAARLSGGARAPQRL